MQNYVLCLKDLCGKTEMNVQVFFWLGIKWVGWEQGMKKVDKILIYFHLLELNFFEVLICENKIKERQ